MARPNMRGAAAATCRIDQDVGQVCPQIPSTSRGIHNVTAPGTMTLKTIASHKRMIPRRETRFM
jgi:hypothetical protein